jgi:hypothetical protein
MSGGFVRAQNTREHQVVIFTFAGKFSRAETEAWNAAILELKRRFAERITGVTLRGERSPQFARRQTRRRARRR